MLPDLTPSTLGDILIVDDTPDNLRLLSEMLVNEQYRVRQAIQGEQALVSAQMSPPDLILLDIMMPGLDGYEICRRLKTDTKTQAIPVIFLSVMDQGIDKARAFEVGGADYICKPFQAVEVLVRVEYQLQVSRLHQQLQEQSRQLQLQNTQLQREVTDRIAAEAALQTLNRSLEAKVEERTQQLQIALAKEYQLNQMKSQLLATISHEFRTPLSVISMAAELISHRLAKSDYEWSQKHFYRIDENIKRLTQVLDNAVLLTLIDSQSLDFKPTLMNLREFCVNLIHQKSLLLSSQHQLSLAEFDSAVFIHADAYLMEQVISNLIYNSVRYSPKSFDIKLSLLDLGEQVLLTIKDNGIGIPEADQEKIFERFYRASNANSIPGTPGAGLGLAVVREVMNLHQGQVSVNSSPDVGTIFILRFPKVVMSQ